MQSKNRFMRLSAALLCAALLLNAGILPHVSAASLDELNREYQNLEARINAREQRLRDAGRAISNNEEKLSALREQVSELESQADVVAQKMTLLNGQISEMSAQIKKMDTQISGMETQLREAQAAIAQREQEMQDTVDELLARLRASYLAGNANWLEAFVQAKSFSAFLTRSELLTRVAAHDKKLVEQLEKESAEIQRQSEQVEKAKASLAAKRSEADTQRKAELAKRNDLRASASVLNVKQREISRQSTNINSLIDSLDKDSAAYKREINKLEAEQARVEAEIDNYIRSHGSKEGSETSPGNSGKMICPVPYSSAYITAGYGPYKPFGSWSQHRGTDICVRPSSQGKKIVAAQRGTVLVSQTGTSANSSYGKYIIIDHGGGIHTLYAHCSALMVSVGQKVSQGQHIANIGATGRVTGAHLHFEVRINQGGSVQRVNAVPKYIQVP